MRNKVVHNFLILLLTFLFVMVDAEQYVPSMQEGYSIPLSQGVDTTETVIEPARFTTPLKNLQTPYEEKESPVKLDDPTNIDYTAEYDPSTGLVTLYRKIGNMQVKLPYTMSVEEYNNREMRQSMQKYWESKNTDTEGGAGGFGEFRVNNEIFESVFGTNTINIRPQGIAEIRLGVNHTKIDNPTLQEKMRKTTTFDFQQKLQMNIRGSIGEKLKLGINYNTEATFDFENQINLEYEGGEDDIIKKIEAGNVSMPLPGTLITGSQSLWGIKTEMQFGKLTISTVFSQQKGETSVMNIQGGAQTQEFDISADAYDANRHFFLSHFFRDNYDKSLANLPIINSGINITKIEVWITNKTSNFDNSRNIVAFTDLGENKNHLSNSSWNSTPGINPSNDANNLYREMTTTYSGIRDINNISAILSSFKTTSDYEKVENARLLTSSEYTLNSRLGYISLNNALNADEILSVAFEYSYNGKTYKVGELSTAGIEAPKSLITKLLKGTMLSPSLTTWDLMMKNIYSIGAYQLSEKNFIMNVTYLNDSTGTDINYFPEGPTMEKGGINGKLFIAIMNLDNLNSRQEYSPDGVFDFVPGYTIIPAQGRIVFPVLEPFGKHLADQLPTQELKDKYAFYELYNSTQTVAKQTAEKNKYRLQGSYKAESGSEISLNAFDIPKGSVIVTAGGLRLTENVDYSVNYTAGSIQILNPGLLQSGTPIQVSLESQSLFNLQTKTLIGSHFDYRFTENFNVGATIMHLSERPLTQKVAYGNEPISNTIWGLNTSYFTESNLLTKWIDKIPFLETKTPSSISFEGEFAQLVPGHPKVIDKAGSSYIDDFEGTKIPLNLKEWTSWKLASTPSLFPESKLTNDLKYGYNRAKLAWYVIDPLFLRNNSLTPSHIKRDEEAQSNHYVREIYENEIFPFRQARTGEPTNISVLNLAYYPSERGPYNFDTNLNPDGTLPSPKQRWAGIMRKIDTNDFEAANIDHIEFWVMDPFIYDEGTHEGGDLYINLGDISEDILKDSRKFFEQGLPGPNEPFDVDSTVWGYIPRKQSLVNAFSNDPATRLMQDVGLNGMSSERERDFYSPYLSAIRSILNPEAMKRFDEDPAADDFHYFRGSDFDRNKTSILERYKDFNNPEGNSKPSENSGESYSAASTTIPDGEDINGDNTLSEAENYYQYRIQLKPNNMEVGENYITDVVSREVKLKNGNVETIKWYQFKVPIITDDSTKVGNPEGKRSIRFMRMFLHNFSDSVVLRFASLDLIRSEWRKYDKNLVPIEDNENNTTIKNTNTKFEISAVNIEENGNREPVNYVLPPGVNRVVDPSNPTPRELNEQALSLKITDLGNNDARAVYKTLNMDLRQYKRLKMDVHAEAISGYALDDGQMSIFIRLGTDYQNNYYEYEIPLELTPHSSSYSNNSIAHRYMVWPENNAIDLPFELLQEIKLKRNDLMRQAGSSVSLTKIFSRPDIEKPANEVKIKGNPNLANVKTIMIGVRNNSIGDKAIEVWVNELRLTDFKEDGGWAANGRLNVKLADLGSVSVAGNVSTAGFGSIDQSVTERSKEDYYQYDIATSLELGKLLGPKNRLSIPFYYSFSKQVATPEYSPLDPDIPLDVALKSAKNSSDRDSIKELSQDLVKRKSISLSNVRLQPKEGTTKFYSPSNLSATYSYNETYRQNIDIEYQTDKNYRGILAYNFVNRPKSIEPFKKLKPKSLALIRDFNFYLAPTQLGYRWELMRGYREEQLRNINNPTYNIPVSVDKDFYWNRYFDLTYNLTKSLKLDFRVTNNASIDEPEGVVNKKLYSDEYDLWKDSVMNNILSFGRTTNYQHNLNVSYTVPINKLPLLDWTSASVNYGALYNWQQGPITTDEYQWGNTIRNSANIQANAQLNFNNLYNKSNYLKGLNRTASRGANQSETVRFTQHNLQMQGGEPFTVNHKLSTTDVTIRVFNESGIPVKGKQVVIDANTLTFVPEQDISSARVIVTGKKVEQNDVAKKMLEYSARLLTSVKNISATYTQNSGTILPGYLPEAKFLGTQSYGGATGPGLPFMLGWQDRDYALQAVDNRWLSTDSTLNTPYMMNKTEDVTIRATLEPIKGLRIDLTGNHRTSNNMSEYYLFDGNGFRGAFNTIENGGFSMSYNIIATAFQKPSKKGAYQSDAFDQFLNNRQTIAERLGSQRVGLAHPTTGEYADPLYDYSPLAGVPYNPSGYPTQNIGVENGSDGYSLSSQEVMIPAFLAAYSGKKASNIFLNPMPSLAYMQPNWRVTYDGLSKIKWVQKYFKSVDVSHAYRSVYTVGNYLTNTDWESFRDGFSFIRDAQGNFVTKYQISGVSISEQFSPLIQINMTWNNSLSTRAEMKKSRILSLGLSNNQMIENYSDEWVIGLGYRFDKMELILGSKANAKKMSSDLNLRADISIRDSYSIIRRIEERLNQMTAGQKIITLKMTADYVLSSRFNVQVFYDRQMNSPYISSSYPITNSSFGVSFRFSLTQ